MSAIAEGGKYLTFEVNGQCYGIALTQINAIIEADCSITPVPEFPAYGKGIINLRGDIIPIIDLRIRFHMPEKPFDSSTCIIVAYSGDPADASYIGFVVDKVYDVTDIDGRDIAPAPKIVSGSKQAYMSSVAKHKDRIVLILDTDVLLTDEIKKAVEAAVQ
ncbi:MAG: chemotaxis protein CheW [Huintestinicola sp.]